MKKFVQGIKNNTYEIFYPLHNACMENDEQLVKEQIEKKKRNINLGDHQGNTPLHIATQYECDKTVGYLLSRRTINAFKKNSSEETALDIAYKNKSRLMIRCFLHQYPFLLHNECENNNFKAIRSLIGMGCDKNMRDDKGNKPLYYILNKTKINKEIAKYMAIEGCQAKNLCENKHRAIKCSYCIEKFKFLDIVSSPECNHIFHKKCIDPWFEKNKECPMCYQECSQIKTLHFPIPLKKKKSTTTTRKKCKYHDTKEIIKEYIIVDPKEIPVPVEPAKAKLPPAPNHYDDLQEN